MQVKRGITIPLMLAVASCPSCVSSINVKVADLHLLEQSQTFSGSGSSVTVIGMLHAVIETDMDLIAYAKKNGYHLSYRVSGCTSDVEFSKWSIFYEKKPKKGHAHSYDILFNYKKPPNWMAEDYNLAQHKEDLCFVVTAASMNIFSFAQSDVARFPMTESFFNKLHMYDMESRPIHFSTR